MKYLKHIVEQNHRTIKKWTWQILDFKSYFSESATLEGIGVAKVIRKGKRTLGLCPFVQFAALAA